MSLPGVPALQEQLWRTAPHHEIITSRILGPAGAIYPRINYAGEAYIILIHMSSLGLIFDDL
jgi:hypothetical protein